MRDIMDFTPIQQCIIIDFIRSESTVDMRDVDPVIVMIENGTVEFGDTGTANEHLHIPGAGLCTRCHAVSVGEAARKILGA